MRAANGHHPHHRLMLQFLAKRDLGLIGRNCMSNSRGRDNGAAAPLAPQLEAWRCGAVLSSVAGIVKMPRDTEIAAASRRTRAPGKTRAAVKSRGGAKASAFDARAAGAALKVLRGEAAGWNAPILNLIAAQEDDPFKTLIGCILSLRTKDQTTALAAPRLFALADTPQRMLGLELGDLEKAIYPVGFYRTKARVIRDICRDLIARFGGRVPDRIDDLLTLKGVGRKTANLVVTQAFHKPGICVDTHVHRISNRWGLVRTKTPEQTEAALRQVLPRRHWIEYNGWLVAFGQTVCQPVSPFCSRCPLVRRCPKLGVVRSR
jgi:endonuclease III